MRRWFLSYHTPDEALAERLKAVIERKDPDLRVFFAPTHLRAGRSWSAQLAEEIAEASAFILLVGERGLGDWQIYDEALDKRVKSPDFPLVMMLLDGQTAPGLPFLRRHHWIITAGSSFCATARERSAICLTPRSPATTSSINPNRRAFFSTSTRARSFTCEPRSISVHASPKSLGMRCQIRACVR
jgi:hypothetical protein